MILRLRHKAARWEEQRHPRDHQGRFAEHVGAGHVTLPGTRTEGQRVSTADLLGSRYRPAGTVKAAMCDSLAQAMNSVLDDVLSDQQRDRLTRVRDGRLAAYRPESGNNGYAEYVEQADLDSGARREPWGYQRMSSEEYHQFVRAEAVSRLVTGWASTANDHDPDALALQDAAQRTFHLDGTLGWNHGDDDLAAETDRVTRDRGHVLDTFLTAMWENTQQHFAALGVTHVTVHRGFTGDYDDSHLQDLDGHGSVTGLPLRPLSSATTDEETARDFSTQGGEVSGYLISGDIPVTRVLAVPGTGIGCLDEAEVVILAGPGEWYAEEVYPSDDDGWHD
ncbi:hypothetical protein HUT16_27205 [Kitasatospora sp. NA04385]|uniref:hypothetical protein n=1 Tax=Kitasatospora sp. NA04385 TaxID=2742135 RepID=UPI0015904E3F|nr:hypothetical protein [Kitasatospora sp. NA04385]QKW22268.1 hypothetical protein HUT16_27205 [Kitasatospora sp. NA04385]